MLVTEYTFPPQSAPPPPARGPTLVTACQPLNTPTGQGLENTIVGVAVFVTVFVEVAVRVFVEVLVGVFVEVFVEVLRGVLVGVTVAVLVEV